MAALFASESFIQLAPSNLTVMRLLNDRQVIRRQLGMTWDDKTNWQRKSVVNCE